MECTHLDQIRKVKPSAKGCEECLKIGSSWVASADVPGVWACGVL